MAGRVHRRDREVRVDSGIGGSFSALGGSAVDKHVNSPPKKKLTGLLESDTLPHRSAQRIDSSVPRWRTSCVQGNAAAAPAGVLVPIRKL